MVDGLGTKEITTMNSVTPNESGPAACVPARVSRGFAAGLALLLMALIGLSVWTAEAESYVGLTGFEIIPSDTQAGGHPDVRLEMTWDASTIKNGEFGAPPNHPCACDDPRRIIQQFPTGFIGNPHATPRCEIVEFSFGRCPPASQIGTAEPFGSAEGEELYVPLYNLVPHPDEPSLTAFWAPLVGAPVFITLGSRTDSDYGLYAEGSAIYHPLVFPGLNINLWGVPSDPVHDPERFTVPLKGFAACGSIFGCSEVTGASANVPLVPYLQAPTTCGVPLTASAELEYYTGEYLTRDDAWPATTGCEQLTFNPSLTAQPTTNEADSPSGVDIELSVPQELSPTTPSPSQIKASTTVLPNGFSLNSNAADGKVACSDADSGIGTRGAATCPDFSKVGTLTLDSTGAAAGDPGRDLPARAPAGLPLPHPARGGRVRNPHQARRLRAAGCADRPAHGLVPGPAAEPAHRLQHAFLRRRARAACHPHPLRDLSGGKRVRPLEQRAPPAALGEPVLGHVGP